MGELADRRSHTQSRVEELIRELSAASDITNGKACVYATGSFGRGEASKFSDLDLFIVGKSEPAERNERPIGSKLKRLDEICLQAELIRVTRKMGFPEFSGDGRYLAHHSVAHLTKTLGTPEDDAANTFTARLLLLLESQPLLGVDVYEEGIKDVIAEYWRDYPDHKSTFMPAFLANDILRLWRTFCVNYEARTEREPDEKKVKGKIKNYKLKHSRMLTCYSAVLYLLSIHRRANTVSPDDVLKMIQLTPTQRIQVLIDEPDFAGAQSSLSSLLNKYELFLDATNASEETLIVKFSDKAQSRRHLELASEFGHDVYKAMNEIGNGSLFHRLLMV